MPARVKVGVSAWTEKTLVESGWYPKSARTPEARLRYYASRFELAEADAPYYAIPSRHQAEVWSERTPDGFTMNVKAYALLTQHHTDPKRLPKDLRQALPPALAGKARVYARDVPPDLIAECARRFAGALEPLRASGKLGVVLLQFPVWFTATRDDERVLAAAPALLPGLRLAVEFRNATWLAERRRERTFALLREHGLVYTCVDAPQGFASSIPPVVAVTAPVALARFHGRNAATWQKGGPTAAQRFAYRYDRAELREWLPRLERLAAESAEVHVVMNNCHRDDGVTNAADMAEMLADARVARSVEAPGVSRPGVTL